VVAVGFRQDPRFRHPAASADVATAVRYVRASGDRLGIEAFGHTPGPVRDQFLDDLAAFLRRFV